MPRKKGQSTVPPQTAEFWLKSVETGEKTISQIKEKDGWDVRTIRKAIADAQLRRESKEGRANFYRWAIEEHHKDLISYAKELYEQLDSYNKILPDLKEKPFWKALKQHMSYSSLWKSLDGIDKVNNDIFAFSNDKNLREKIIDIINKMTKTQSKLKPHGICSAILETIGQPGVDYNEIQCKPYLGEGPSKLVLMYRDIDCSSGLEESDASRIQKEVVAIVQEVEKWFKSMNLRDFWQRRMQYKKKALEELQTIILRRVVPGKCRYCPD